ncbi:LCP family protein [Streptomyces sp. RB6PN25]|uniref:LCP family protein n=1 Tax=Streptomyces humicola TaxID=2953240 RepID=A0ABT1PW93_9ACTN|nr:LCP family protein [Streptomyces humicola]MCQ4081936.1 LCP family protein [Streptomyces humicola]
MSGEQEQYGQDPYAQRYYPAPEDPYAAGGYQQQYPHPQVPPQQPSYDSYDHAAGYYQEQQGQGHAHPQQPQQQYAQQQVHGYPVPPQYQPQPHPQTEPQPQPEPQPQAESQGGFDTEMFAFIEEENEQAEDVIDWLKFSESRTERRDERKRRGRKRVTALVVVLVLAAVGGVGYLWKTGRLPGLGGASAAAQAATGAQKRNVIVVNLRPVDSNDSSTALLVDNQTTGKGSTVLLPNSLTVPTDTGGTTTLGNSVIDQGAGPTRDALNTLLGANIQGIWRLDTPYLEILVDSLGDITVDTDATVKADAQDGGKTLVTPGKQQDLDGQAAVAYATYRGPGESEQKQLARFGQVMQAVLMKMPSDAESATKIVDAMGAILDPSLTDQQLGASLAQLSNQVKNGGYQTAMLPVQPNGTLSAPSSDSVVKDILGGAVKNSDPSGTPTVAVKNASGNAGAASSAQVAVVNSGYTYVDGGTASPVQSRSQIVYTADAQAQTAHELAKTLGLSDNEVSKGQGQPNATITVVLGSDYKG